MLPRALFLFLLVMLAPPLSLQQEQQQAASLANIFDLAKAGRYVPPLLCFLHGEIERQRPSRRSSVNIWTFGRNNLSLNGCGRWWWIHHPLSQLSLSAVSFTSIWWRPVPGSLPLNFSLTISISPLWVPIFSKSFTYVLCNVINTSGILHLKGQWLEMIFCSFDLV